MKSLRIRKSVPIISKTYSLPEPGSRSASLTSTSHIDGDTSHAATAEPIPAAKANIQRRSRPIRDVTVLSDCFYSGPLIRYSDALRRPKVAPTPQALTPSEPQTSLRHVVITGGSRGIGLAIAQLFAKENYRCTLISRNVESLKAAISTLKPIRTSGEVSDKLDDHGYIAGDVSDPNFWTHEQVGKALIKTGQSMPNEEEDRKLEEKAIQAQKEREETEEIEILRSALKSMGREDMELEASSTRLWPEKIPDSEPGLTPRPESEGFASENAIINFHDTRRLVGRLSPAEQARKHIDVLVNCAGISEKQLFFRTEPKVMKDVIDTNLTGLMLGTQYLLRHRFLQQRNTEKKHSPTIINVSSLLAIRGGFGAVAYASSKAGVLGFTRALSSELGTKGVRVNAIVPGYIETDMLADFDPEVLARRVPLGRLGRPDEIADTALFLARNQYANNCVINIDGGLSVGAL